MTATQISKERLIAVLSNESVACYFYVGLISSDNFADLKDIEGHLETIDNCIKTLETISNDELKDRDKWLERFYSAKTIRKRDKEDMLR